MGKSSSIYGKSSSRYDKKNLRKAIFKRSQLKTMYFKTKPAKSLRLYKKQKNFWGKLYKKERNKYYSSLKLNKVTDNKAFWKAVKPFLFDEGTNKDKITLVNNDKVISDDKQLCKTFSNFSQEAARTQGVSDSFNICNYSNSDLVNNAIRNYENHSSVKKIRETITITSTFLWRW